MSNIIPDTSWWQDSSTFLSSAVPLNYTSNAILNDPNLNPVNVTDPSIQLNKLKGGQIDSSKITPRPKQTFSNKFANSTFGKNFGAWSAGLDTANNMFTGIFGEKNEYSGEKGNITRAMDTGYDAIQNAAAKFGPYGQLVSLGMGANKLLGNVANKLGAGTDAMTNTDAILGSAFLQLTPIGLINGIGGKKANTITKNNDVFETIGASYGGTNTTVDNSLTKSGKKYGLFSGGARKEANAQIAEAKRQQSVMEGIADTTIDRFNIRNSMAAINGNRKAFNLQGGYDQSSIRVGKKGLKLSPKEARRIAKQKRIKKIQEEVRAEEVAGFQSGGTIQDPFNIYLQSLPENQRDSTNFRVKDYWIFNGKPKNFKEALERGMFTPDKEGFYHARSISENPETGEIEYMKASNHPTRHMESDWYEKGLVYTENEDGTTSVIQLKPGMAGYDDWKNFTNNYELVKSEPYWKYVKRTSKVTKHEQGGSIKGLVSFIKPITPDDILEFQNGGTIISPISYMADGGQVNKKTRTLEELIKYAKEQNPRFIQRLSEEPRGITFTDDEGNEARGSHYLEWSTDDKGNAVIYPRIQENDKKELQFFNPNDAYIRAIQNKNFLIMSPEEAEIFFSEDPKYGTAYKSGWPQFFNKFEKGGSINVIPEGALHARKHNMDMEGITKKGIPVVSNNGEQQAEIEREEIIYRLEVTQKLEELMKKYYSEDTSKKEKDELALEAGKLLTQETLYNTQDNTNNLI